MRPEASTRRLHKAKKNKKKYKKIKKKNQHKGFFIKSLENG
jgi:hypothetical protein